jgi:uncharacterized protein YndB with AHSA1/START domain
MCPAMNPAINPAINPAMSSTYRAQARLDLFFTRDIDVPRALVWRAWTEPELLKQWFCPRPWTTTDCEIDLRPGGIFRTTMRSPEGRLFPNLGSYLEIVPNERLVWTNALLPGFRPSLLTQTCGTDEAGFQFSATIELADHAQGTRYSATVQHADEAACQKHAAMGFEVGWGMALDQLVAMVKQGVSGG